MSTKILVLGKNGQLGRALMALLGEQAHGLGHGECNLLDPDFIKHLAPLVGTIDAVVNASAYTQVDKAEGEGRADAFRVNGSAVGELAGWCKQHGIPFVHVSTDYVFEGSGDTPYREEDATKPLNAYGASKLAGEVATEAVGGQYLIFRTSWVYDAVAANFFTKMLSLFRSKTTLQVVDDQVGAPTYAPHLAEGLVAALASAQAQTTFPSGVYHLCNQGEVNRYDNATMLLALAKPRDPAIVCQSIAPVPTSTFPMPAARPLNSRLNCSKAKYVLGVTLPDWKDGLNAWMETIYAGL